MFIRGFPLYGYLMTVSTLIFSFFYRPLWIIPRRVKWFEFSVGTMEVKHQTHRHSKGWSASGPMFIRGFPLYGYFMTVSTPIFANLSPVVNYSSSGKMVWIFSRHYGGETSNSSTLLGSIGIRPHVYKGFLLYGYFMAVSTPIFANFIARCELFRVE